MRIVMVTTNDPAGAGIALARAINRHTPHECRLVTTELRYNFVFTKDLHVPWLRSYDDLERTLATADVFHFHMVADEDLALGPFTVRQFLRGQPVVHHHHGEPPFRADPRKFAERELAAGRPAIVATPDLLRVYPEATWLPNVVPLDDPDYMPAQSRSDPDAFVVAHSPTRRELKNTEEFVAIMHRLAQRHPQARADVIEHTEHRHCLRRKQAAHVAFDHMQGYFGVSSLETLSQGVPTVAGLDAWNLTRIRTFARSEDVPWTLARDGQELFDVLEHFLLDAEHRRGCGVSARAWMQRHWSPARIATACSEFYESL